MIGSSYASAQGRISLEKTDEVFHDVKAAAYYADAVKWARENSIVNGAGDLQLVFTIMGFAAVGAGAFILIRYQDSTREIRQADACRLRRRVSRWFTKVVRSSSRSIGILRG